MAGRAWLLIHRLARGQPPAISPGGLDLDTLMGLLVHGPVSGAREVLAGAQ